MLEAWKLASMEAKRIIYLLASRPPSFLAFQPISSYAHLQVSLFIYI